MLPEYLIEDITELLTFVSKCVAPVTAAELTMCGRYAPHVLAEGSQDELMTFMLVFLSTPYMKNPYLKGQFVEVRLLFPRRSTDAVADHVLPHSSDAALPSRIARRRDQLSSACAQEPYVLSLQRLRRYVILPRTSK